MLGQELVIIVRQNYIRPDPSEPNLPAWVPRQIARTSDQETTKSTVRP